jgi:hypothetical protein
MIKAMRFPLLYILEAVLFIPLCAGFVATVSFAAARPMAELDLQGRTLPATWEAAIPNHGRFLQGYLVANHPIAFSAVIVTLLGSAVALYWVHREQMAQRAAAQGRILRAHQIANACTFAFWIALSYTLVTHILVGVSPI